MYINVRNYEDYSINDFSYLLELFINYINKKSW